MTNAPVPPTSPKAPTVAAPAVAPAPAQQPPAASPAPAVTGPVVQTHQAGKYLVKVINEKCIGAASCVAIAPKVFQLNEQNIAEILSQDGNDDDTKLLAAQSCPTSAIVVVDTTTGQQVWPREV